MPFRAVRRPFLWLCGAFLAGWSLHYLARRFLAVGWDTPLEGFPVSVMAPNLALSGLPALAGYLLLAWWAVARADGLGGLRLWLVSCGLLLLGNLGQGGFAAGFLDPLFADGMQYGADAARIDDWWVWLADFNVAQPNLGEHARYHPPFAVLLIHLLVEVFGPGGAALALTFTASLVPPLLLSALRVWCDEAGARRVALALALLPAFGIYGAVSLDAAILLPATLILWGIARWPGGGWSVGGWSASAGAAMLAGLLAMSLLTFLSLLPLAAAGLWALARRDFRLLAALAVATLATAGAFALLWPLAGYDHWQAFRTAEALHNPEGWWGLSRPGLYLASRLECVMENLLFFSFPLAALWLAARPWRAWREPAALAALAMLAVYALFLLSGGAHTGETARTLLFLYPWVLGGLCAIGRGRQVEILLMAAAAQTAAMQFGGDYFW